MTDPNNESDDDPIGTGLDKVCDTDNEKTKDTEKQLINQLMSEHSLKEGDMYFVLPKQWWVNWKDYVCYDGPAWRFSSTNIPPGPVDNTVLLDVDKETLRKSADVYTVPKPVWEKLIQWYGGGPAITRKCVREGHTLFVEIRDMEFYVLLSSKMKIPEFVSFSKATTIGEFRDEMQKRLGFIPEKVRIWDFLSGKKERELRDMSKTLSDVDIRDKQYVLIEEKKKNGLWPSNRRYMKFRLAQCYWDSPAEPGQTGMENYGNICFMISAIQCLSNIVPLTDYFLSGKFNEAINENNPLGMKGEIAKEFANLLKELWSSNTSVVDPQKMKMVIEKFAPRFAGYQQHDAQELLAFFLDGLHEDLNCITCKLDVPNVEGGEQDDARIAVESWKNYKLRNDSIIVNNFQGLLKSTLVCPVNGRVSVTFDPFMYLSVPLPVGMTRRIPVRVHFLEKSSQDYDIEIDKFASIINFKWELSKLCGIEAERLVVCEICLSNFHQIFEDDTSVSTIRKLDDIHVYEILCDHKPNPKEHASLYQIDDANNSTTGQDINNNQTKMHVETNGETGVNGSDHTNSNKEEDSHQPPSVENNLDFVHIFVVHALASYYSFYAGENFGTPMIESIPRYITYRQLYTHLISRLSLVLKKIPDTNISLEVTEEKQSSEDVWDDYSRYTYKQTPIRFGAIFEIISTDKFGKISDDFKNDDFPLKLYEGQWVLLKWSEKTKNEYYNLEKEKKEKKTENPKNEKPITLYDCLDLFTSEETLAPENKWYCSECKEFQQATKKFGIWSAPSILVIHLKRFLCKTSIYGMFRDKLTPNVIFPLTDLDLTKYVIGPIENPPIYDLVALSNHHGTVNVGHYITYALHRNNRNWYSFDDSRVTPLSTPLEQFIITPSAYVLFYKRKDVEWPPLDPSWEMENDSEESSGGEEDTVGGGEEDWNVEGGENGEWERDEGDEGDGEDGEDGEDGGEWERKLDFGRNGSDREVDWDNDSG